MTTEAVRSRRGEAAIDSEEAGQSLLHKKKPLNQHHRPMCELQSTKSLLSQSSLDPHLISVRLVPSPPLSR